MKVTEVSFDPHCIIGPADAPGSGLAPRSSGPHLSQIYRDLELTIGAAKSNDLTEDELTYYRSTGFIWEWVIERAFATGLMVPDSFRPGEQALDGITGSPDLICTSTDPWTVIDTKATTRSWYKSDNLEKYFWSWTVQLKGYCKLMDTNLARLLILHVNGDYKPPRPKVRQLNLEFNAIEINDNWSMVVRHAIKRGWLPAPKQKLLNRKG